MEFDPKRRRIEAAAVTLGYAVLVAFVAARHEPWFDEAQAWLLARDAGIRELFLHYLRYEGSPGLWHAILLVPAKLGMPYRAITAIGVSAAVAGVWVWARYSPVPRLIRILVPFTFFLFYQYAVVARSYNLMPGLLFALAAVHRRAREHQIKYAALLALLANTCLPGTLIAGGLLLALIVEFASQPRPASTTPERSGTSRLLSSFVIVIVGFILVAIQVRPPADLLFPHKPQLRLMAILDGTAQIFIDSFTEITILSLAVLGVSLWWFWKRRVLLVYAAATLPLLLLFTVIYHQPWHEGILILVWLFALWLSFDRAEPTPDTSPAERRLLLAAALAVVGVQLVWAFRTSADDVRSVYSASAETARFLEGKTIKRIYGVGFSAIAVLPYFKDNIYDNLNRRGKLCSWDWSTHNPMNQSPETILRERPDLIVYGIKSRIRDGIGIAPDPRYLLREYRMVEEFPGNLFWKGRAFESETYEVLERRHAAAAPP